MQNLGLVSYNFLNLFSDAVLIIDDSGKILFKNKSALKKFSFLKKDGELISEFIEKLLESSIGTDQTSQDFKDFWPIITQKKRYSLNRFEYRIDNKIEAISIKSIKLHDQNSSKIMLVFSDLEISQAELNSQKALIRILGHELKQPLNLISTYNYYLNKFFNRLGSKPQEEQYLFKIDEKVRQLNTMLNDITNNVRTSIADFPIKKEEILIEPFIKSILEDYDRLQPNRSLNFSTKLPANKLRKLTINADVTRTKQVLSNLLNNSIKYSPHLSPVDIFLSLKNDRVEIAIKDYGEGISAKELTNIFKPYYRIKKKRENTISGLGLGLSLSKIFMKKQGGEIKVESKVGKGSTFTLIFNRL